MNPLISDRFKEFIKFSRDFDKEFYNITNDVNLDQKEELFKEKLQENKATG